MARPKMKTENVKVKINLTLSLEAKKKLELLRDEKDKSASELVELWVEKEWKRLHKK